MSKTSYCEGCKGSMRCNNPYSPCYLYYCGEYPGTGPDPKLETTKNSSANNGEE